MRIVIGEVEESDGNYKMKRAMHMELTDADFEMEPNDFIEKYLRGAMAQLVAWHDEKAVRH